MYGRRNYGRRTGFKRRRFRKGYDRTGGLFYGRFNKKRRFGGRAHIEKKFVDFSLSGISNDTDQQFMTIDASPGPATETNTICDIVQGTTESQRIGRKCTITNINLRLKFRWTQKTFSNLLVAQETTETFRFIIYLDRQCNGAAVTTGDILDTDEYNAYRNLSNVKRFKLLYDKVWTWNTTAIAAGNGTSNDSELVVKEYAKHINIKTFIPIEFDGTTTGVLTSIKSNNIGIIYWAMHGSRMAISDSKLRIRFIDF